MLLFISIFFPGRLRGAAWRLRVAYAFRNTAYTYTHTARVHIRMQKSAAKWTAKCVQLVFTSYLHTFNNAALVTGSRVVIGLHKSQQFFLCLCSVRCAMAAFLRLVSAAGFFLLFLVPFSFYKDLMGLSEMYFV